METFAPILSFSQPQFTMKDPTAVATITNGTFCPMVLMGSQLYPQHPFGSATMHTNHPQGLLQYWIFKITLATVQENWIFLLLCFSILFLTYAFLPGLWESPGAGASTSSSSTRKQVKSSKRTYRRRIFDDDGICVSVADVLLAPNSEIRRRSKNGKGKFILSTSSSCDSLHSSYNSSSSETSAAVAPPHASKSTLTPFSSSLSLEAMPAMDIEPPLWRRMWVAVLLALRPPLWLFLGSR